MPSKISIFIISLLIGTSVAYAASEPDNQPSTQTISNIQILAAEAQKIIGNEAAKASLQALDPDANNQLENIIQIVEAIKFTKSIELICPIATHHPNLLNTLIAAEIKVDSGLTSLVLAELHSCQPQTLIATAKNMMNDKPQLTPLILQQVQILIPSGVHELIEFIANLDLPPDLQEDVANVINTPATAAVLPTAASPA